MRAKSKKTSIDRWRSILCGTNVTFTITPSGNLITIEGPNVKIAINHSADYHWTIRLPGTAEDGMRFAFDVDVNIDQNSHLITINDLLAIRYV